MLTLIHQPRVKISAGLKCALCKYPQTPTRGRDRVWGRDLAPGLEPYPSTTVSSWTREELVSDAFNFPEDNGMVMETPDEIPGALENCRRYNRQCDRCPGLSGLKIRLSINASSPFTFIGRECCWLCWSIFVSAWVLPVSSEILQCTS